MIAGLLFMAGMRRSEVRALHWADVVDSADGDGMLVTVRRSKTNPEGEVNDVRFVKDGVARALRTLRAATNPEAGDRVVPLSPQMIGLRFTAAAQAAGVVESRVTAHSGRVGLASELTSRGASTTDVMLRRQLEDQPHGGALLRRCNRGARCCRTVPVSRTRRPRRTGSRPTLEQACGQARRVWLEWVSMNDSRVAHYSAGATAERGAAARYPIRLRGPHGSHWMKVCSLNIRPMISFGEGIF